MSVEHLFPEPVSVNLSNNQASGSWFQISKQHDTPKDEINMDVFKLWIDHGAVPANATYQYIVVPSINESEIEHYIEQRATLSSKNAIKAGYFLY